MGKTNDEINRILRGKIEHPDPNRMSGGTLQCQHHQPLTKLQSELEAGFVEILERHGYLRLHGADLIEVIPNLNFQKDSFTYFGPQPTVEMVLFMPFWE